MSAFQELSDPNLTRISELFEQERVESRIELGLEISAHALGTENTYQNKESWKTNGKPFGLV
jgi:hypothetical protein